MKEVVYGDYIFTQKYMITEDGKVFNETRGKFLRYRLDKDGYWDYTLYTTKGAKHFRVARIVLSTYAPTDGYENLVANHKDGNVNNNNLSNLEWTTVRGNTIHAYQNGLAHGNKGSKNSQAKLRDEDVIYIYKCPIKEFTNTELSNKFGVSPSAISMIRTGKTWTHITKDL